MRIRESSNRHPRRVGMKVSTELHQFCGILAVFIPQVAIRFHRERAAVLVAQPPRNGRDVYARFNTAGREIMPHIVMSEHIRIDGDARRLQHALDALHFENPALRRSAALLFQTLQELPQFRKKGNDVGIAFRHLEVQQIVLPIDVLPVHVVGGFDASTGIRQELKEESGIIQAPVKNSFAFRRTLVRSLTLDVAPSRDELGRVKSL